MNNKTIYDCPVIELPRHQSERLGNLTVVQSSQTVPFDVKRIFYIYDVPGGESRGGHAHKEIYQFIIAVSGSFAITLDDGRHKKTILLNRPYLGLLIVPGIWATLEDFSSGAVALVLTSDHYNPEEYINDYHEFLQQRNAIS